MIDQRELERLTYEVLVEQHLRRNRTSFNTSSVAMHVVEGCRGVYAIWWPGSRLSAPRCLHVGMSGIDLQRRLLDHLQHSDNGRLRWYIRHYGSWLEFSFEYVADGRKAKDLESEMIGRLKPECNEHENRRPARMHPIARTFATKGGLPTMPRTRFLVEPPT